MLEAPLFSAALWSFCLSFDLINFFFYVAVRSFRFPQKYPIIYATAIFFISPFTVDNVTFFMIQLIIFGLDSFYLYSGGHKEGSWEKGLSYANCGPGPHQPKRDEIWWKAKGSLFLYCNSNGIIASLPRIFHAPIKFGII